MSSRRAKVWRTDEQDLRSSLADALRFVPCTLVKCTWSFKPVTIGDAPHSPTPHLGRPLKKRSAATGISSEECLRMRNYFLKEATDLEEQVEPLSVELMIGENLIDGTLTIARCLKDWAHTGRLMKGSMRSHLRNIGIALSVSEADTLFDSWDADGGGTLEPHELSECLSRCEQKMLIKRSEPDPKRERAEKLRRKAVTAEHAAELADAAVVLEDAVCSLVASMEKRADVKLGELLQARMVKPGAVVRDWGSSRGAHAGELSRAHFRSAVLRLFRGASPSDSRRAADLAGSGSGATTERTRPGTARRTRAQTMLDHVVGRSADSTTAEQAAETAALIAEIDGVFDQFDADHGGYLDEDEAKAMIKTLQVVAQQAASERRAKEAEAKAMRTRANRLGMIVRETERQVLRSRLGNVEMDELAC